MKLSVIAAIASLAHMASAVGVVGKAEGFAHGVTGGEFRLHLEDENEPHADDNDLQRWQRYSPVPQGHQGTDFAVDRLYCPRHCS